MILDYLEHLDHVITLGINHLSAGWSDPFWLLLSDRDTWFPAYAIIAFMLVQRLGWRKSLVVIVSIILTIVLADQLSNAIKHGIERLRPCFNTWMLGHGLHWPEVRGGNFFGFFSGHASNTFAFIACALIGFRNDHRHRYNAFAWWGYTWAALVSISRIMLGKHFIGDILVGTLFGITVGVLMGWAARWVIVRLIEREPVTWRTFLPQRPTA